MTKSEEKERHRTNRYRMETERQRHTEMDWERQEKREPTRDKDQDGPTCTAQTVDDIRGRDWECQKVIEKKEAHLTDAQSGQREKRTDRLY